MGTGLRGYDPVRKLGPWAALPLKGDKDIPHYMTPSEDDRSLTRAGEDILNAISAQLDKLGGRIGQDIDKHRGSADSGGFLLYYLTDQAGEPLKSTQVSAAGITKLDIESTVGFDSFLARCEEQSASLRIDEHFYSDDPQATTIYRVIVDGWAE